MRFGRSLAHDIARLGALWNDGLERFGGPFLAGRAFSAVDAFFAPVAFRIQSYNLILDTTSAAYARRLTRAALDAGLVCARRSRRRCAMSRTRSRSDSSERCCQDLRQR